MQCMYKEEIVDEGVRGSLGEVSIESTPFGADEQPSIEPVRVALSGNRV